jgi:hypothetical protein
MAGESDRTNLRFFVELAMLLSLLLGGLVWQVNVLKRIELELQALHQLNTDRWKGQDQIIWSQDLRDSNRELNLNVPDAAKIMRERREREFLK